MRRHHMKPGFFSCVHRSSYLLFGSVINTHDPRQCFTLELFRPAYRNGLNRNACKFISSSVQNQRCSQVTVISCLSINVPSPSAGKSLIYTQKCLQMLDPEQNLGKIKGCDTLFFQIITTYNNADHCTGHQDSPSSIRAKSGLSEQESQPRLGWWQKIPECHIIINAIDLSSVWFLTRLFCCFVGGFWWFWGLSILERKSRALKILLMKKQILILLTDI